MMRPPMSGQLDYRTAAATLDVVAKRRSSAASCVALSIAIDRSPRRTRLIGKREGLSIAIEASDCPVKSL